MVINIYKTEVTFNTVQTRRYPLFGSDVNCYYASWIKRKFVDPYYGVHFPWKESKGIRKIFSQSWRGGFPQILECQEHSE